MTDIKVDAIASLMPLGARTIGSTAAFATYLDQAWCCTTETVAPAPSSAATDEPPSRSSSARDETAPGATDRTRRDRNRKDDDAIRDPAEDNALVAGAPDPSAQHEETPAVADPAGEAEPSTDTAGNADIDGNAAQAQPAEGQESAQSPEDSGTAANQPSGNEAGTAGAQPADVAAVDEAANAQAADTQAAEGDVSETSVRAEGPAADSVQPSVNGETQGAAETAVADGASGENASQQETEGGQEQSEADTAKNSTLQDAAGEGEMEPDGQQQPGLQSESSRSQPRYEGPVAGREPVTAANQANEQPGSQNTNAPPQTVTTAANPAAAAVAAAAPPVDASSPTASVTNAGSAEAIDGVGADTRTTVSAARGPRSNATAPEANQADGVSRARFVQRVARAFQANGDKDGTIRMRLSPPELGSLRAEITVRQGVMNARLETETEAARQLVLENLPALQERLAEQGIKVQQFQVDVGDQQTGDMPGQMENRANPDGSGASEGDARRQSSRRNPMAQESESSSDRRTRRADEIGRLDVLV